MLYVDGMNGIIANNETICWLYQLLDSPVLFKIYLLCKKIYKQNLYLVSFGCKNGIKTFTCFC